MIDVLFSMPLAGSKINPASPPDAALHRNLRLFVLGVCCAVFAIYAVTTTHARDVALFVARREMLNLAQSLLAEESDCFELADRSVQDISERVRLHGTSPGAAADIADSMALLVKAMPRLRLLRVIDADGRILIDNTSPSGHPGIRLSHRDYFIYHRTHSSTEAYLSGPFNSTTEHMWVVTVSRRINDDAGRFTGVAEALIPRTYFQNLYVGVDLGSKGLHALFRDDGTGKVLIDDPRALNFPHSIPQAPWFHGSLGRMQSASYQYLVPFDHAWRIIGFSRSSPYHLLQTASFGVEDALTAWRRDAIINFAVALAIALLFIGLGSALGAQIERRRTAELARARLALFDPLTGLANRRQFDAFLARAWLAAARRRHTPIAMLFIDPDSFRMYVESYGQVAANAVLQAIARVLCENVRSTDLAARYGGESFTVVLPLTDAATAHAIAESIRLAVTSLRIEHATTARRCVTISIGIAAITPTVSSEPGMLLVAADRALFEAKIAGRDRSRISAQTALGIATPKGT